MSTEDTVTRQATNTVYYRLICDTDIVEQIRQAPNDRLARFAIHYAFQALLNEAPGYSLARELASVALLYCNWDIVLLRLQGKEWSWE